MQTDGAFETAQVVPVHENKTVGVRVDDAQLDAVTAQLLGAALALDEAAATRGLHNITAMHVVWVCGVGGVGVSNGRDATRACAGLDAPSVLAESLVRRAHELAQRLFGGSPQGVNLHRSRVKGLRRWCGSSAVDPVRSLAS